jgi:signal transduction histidine kinase
MLVRPRAGLVELSQEPMPVQILGRPDPWLRLAAIHALLSAQARYAVMLALVGLAWLLRIWMAPVEAGLPFVTFYPAIAISAVLCGLWPSLLASILCGGLALQFFLPPLFAPGSYSLSSLIIYEINAVIVCLTTEAMHRYHARYRGAVQRIERVNKRLTESNRDLEQFAYAAAHDLREPLRQVSTFVSMIERRYNDKLDQDGREFIAFARNGALRANQLVLDLLDYSMIGRMELPKIAFSLDTILRQVTANMDEEIVACRAEVRIRPGMPRMIGNEIELTRLFQNLISNALKFRSPDRRPEVDISAERKAGFWQVSVTDNGIGIAPEYFTRIFNLFERLHGIDSFEGTGIGLAVSRKVAELHGGHITVLSREGQGSTFLVTLPAG